MSDDDVGTTQPSSRHRPEAGEGKVSSPTKLTGAAWKYVARRTFREFSADHCTDLAAALTYRALLALFPGLIAVLGLISLFGKSKQSIDTLLGLLSDVGGAKSVDTLRPTVESLAHSSGGGLAFVLGLAGAVWSASGYVGAFGRSLNRVYDIEEGRPIWKLRPWMLLVTCVLVVLVAAVLLVLVVSGPLAEGIGNIIGLGSTAVTVWQIAKWPALLIVLVLIVAILYYATPNVKQPRFRWISVGAAVAIITWLVLSLAFAFYIANFSNYNKTYGTLAGVIVFLLWLWITNVALLFGAELDAEMERGRELQSGLPAEERLQLGLRDDRGIVKRREQGDEAERRGAELRRTEGRSSDDPHDHRE
ncbi:YihY/virulence factor BrkB family protein [Segeticoccus rhizosphaerae]|uniref:YihY/virulence factor BrkB family protein n=1 Tax=Segeticoccus rhizosphaerae TaxID=1104777 RepID=UPI0013901BC8|nr:MULTISPECIES: YihY/virulence factor BrkB family protein [Intrasporangiaceae]